MSAVKKKIIKPGYAKAVGEKLGGAAAVAMTDTGGAGGVRTQTAPAGYADTVKQRYAGDQAKASITAAMGRTNDDKSDDIAGSIYKSAPDIVKPGYANDVARKLGGAATGGIPSMTDTGGAGGVRPSTVPAGYADAVEKKYKETIGNFKTEQKAQEEAAAREQWKNTYGINSEKIRDDTLAEARNYYERMSATYGTQAENLRQRGLSNSGYAAVLERVMREQENAARAQAYADYSANEAKNAQGYAQYKDAQDEKQKAQKLEALQAASTLLDNYPDNPDTVKKMLTDYYGYDAETVDAIIADAQSFKESAARGGITANYESTAGVYSNLVSRGMSHEDALQYMRDMGQFAEGDLSMIDKEYGLQKEWSAKQTETLTTSLSGAISAISAGDAAGGYELIKEHMDETARQEYADAGNDPNKQIMAIYNYAKRIHASDPTGDNAALLNAAGTARVENNIKILVAAGGESEDADGEPVMVYDLIKNINKGEFNDSSSEGIKGQMQAVADEIGMPAKIEFGSSDKTWYGGTYDCATMTFDLLGKKVSIEVDYHSKNPYEGTLKGMYPDAPNGQMVSYTDGDGRHLYVKTEKGWMWLKKADATSNYDDVSDDEWTTLWECFVTAYDATDVINQQRN